MAAAQVSVGMLGVISTITPQAISAYNLKETLWREDFGILHGKARRTDDE